MKKINCDYFFAHKETLLSGDESVHYTINARDGWMFEESNKEEMMKKAEDLKSQGFKVYINEESVLADILLIPSKMKTHFLEAVNNARSF